MSLPSSSRQREYGLTLRYPLLTQQLTSRAPVRKHSQLALKAKHDKEQLLLLLQCFRCRQWSGSSPSCSCSFTVRGRSSWKSESEVTWVCARWLVLCPSECWVVSNTSWSARAGPAVSPSPPSLSASGSPGPEKPRTKSHYRSKTKCIRLIHLQQRTRDKKRKTDQKLRKKTYILALSQILTPIVRESCSAALVRL